MLLTFRLNRSKNIKYSWIMARLSMRRTRYKCTQGVSKISVHSVFDVKHCGKFKARLVVDRHLTKEPNEIVYTGVVSLRDLRLAIFLAELNGLQLWRADVGDAYLHAFILWLDLSLKSYKDMFLLCMVQDLGEHVGKTNFLIFSTKWISICWKNF